MHYLTYLAKLNLRLSSNLIKKNIKYLRTNYKCITTLKVNRLHHNKLSTTTSFG